MAELVAGAVLGTVVGTRLNELILIAKRAYRCKGDCKNLVGTLESIAPLLTDSVNSLDLGNPNCKAWLQDVHTLLVEAQGIVEDCVVKRSKFSNKYVKRRYLSSKIQDISRLIHGKLSAEEVLVALNIVQEINSKVDRLSIASLAVGHSLAFEMQPVPSVTVAFENNPFQELREWILSVPSTITKTIGVKGKGGSGKTLLAKMVNNDEDIRRRYGDDSILWMTIGQDVSVLSIYERMSKFLNDGGVFERDISQRDLEAQRTYLMEAFKQKRALVILDDIWGNCEKNHPMIYWLDIFKGDGSTTLIITRDNKVLDCAKATERIEVESLSKEESWKLFSFYAFQPNIRPSHEVKAIAMEICDECKGLPLALEVIGGALWETKDVRGWKYALSRLKNCESWSTMASMEDELFRSLKFSYDVLSVDAKKCFLYFAAFPEDYDIPIKQLCTIWHAQELFGSGDVEYTMNIGWSNLITLADRSLIDLDDDGEHVKMHDVVRDLAMRIIRDARNGEWAYECQFEPGKVLKTLPKIKESTKRVSFIGTHVANLDSQLCYVGYNLQMCLLSSFTFGVEGEISTSLPRNFFSNMVGLLYLNLSECNSLEELPESIKELKSLTHLILHGCESLEELPENIKELKSLMHLDLSGCKSLKELPESIKELKSLTHLDLSGCKSLKELPKSIKELKSHTHLDLSGCKSLKELPESIKELKSLTHLDLSGCKSLKELPESIKELKSLRHLDLSGCKSLKELPESIKELKSLTHLILRGCESLEELPESIKELKSLTHLDLSECKSLKELPQCIKGLKALIRSSNSSGCEFLGELPESINESSSLIRSGLSGCEFLQELPESIKESSSLMRLCLDWCLKMVKSLSYVPIHEPEEYLKLTRICMKRVQNITLSVTSSTLKFNNRQCKYLVDKLKSVVMDADSFLKSIKMKCLQSPRQKESLRAYCLKIFKLFYAEAKEVEDFIQSNCVKDAWIQVAMSLTNVSEYVSAIGFDLELWKRVFSQSEILEVGWSYSLTDVDTIFKDEVTCVEKKALGDKEMLLRNVNVVLEKESETSAEFQLAALLRERLKGKSNMSFDILQSRMARLGESVLPNLKNEKPLGKGSAAEVHEATLLGVEVAVKTFDGLDNIHFREELSVLRKLSHPNIISSLCSGTYPRGYRHGNRRSKCWIVIEKMDGDLERLIETRIGEGQSKKDDNSQPPFDIMEAVDVMLQVGTGMQYLHGEHIVHRDLKANNILVRRVMKHEGIEYVVAKVADFGLSKTKNTMTNSTQTLNQGTTRWMAPEMMKACAGGSEQAVISESKDEELKHPFKTDIYSYGIVCFEILTGDLPFSEVECNNEVKKLVSDGKRPSLPDQCPPSLKCLIERCWSPNPTERPDFGEICANLRHIKCLLLMRSAAAFEEVKPAQSVNIPKQVASASNTSTIGVFYRGEIIILFFLSIITFLCTFVWFRT